MDNLSDKNRRIVEFFLSQQIFTEEDIDRALSYRLKELMDLQASEAFERRGQGSPRVLSIYQERDADLQESGDPSLSCN